MSFEPTPLGAGRKLRGGRACYRIDGQPLGKGGMGFVQAAVEIETERPVAIKILAVPGLEQRFKREAEIGFQLQHANLVRVEDMGWLGKRPFFVMDRLRGCTLGEALATPANTAHQGVGPSGDASALEPDLLWKVRLTIYVARGLAMLHAHNLIHRDVKPGNIFLCQGPADVPMEPKLLDFGIAKNLLTRESEATRHGGLGSSGYTPPEQSRGDAKLMGLHTDVWALGAVLFRLVDGRSFEDKYLAGGSEPPSKAWDPRLWRVVAKALQHETQARYPTIAGFARELQEWAGGLPFDVGGPLGHAVAGGFLSSSKRLTFDHLAPRYGPRFARYLAVPPLVLGAFYGVWKIGSGQVQSVAAEAPASAPPRVLRKPESPASGPSSDSTQVLPDSSGSSKPGTAFEPPHVVPSVVASRPRLPPDTKQPSTPRPAGGWRGTTAPSVPTPGPSASVRPLDP